MKFAVSSYSLSSLVSKGEATEKELISIAKELGFDGIELAEIHTPDGMEKIEYAKELKAECEKVGIVPVQYSVGADFIYGSDGDLEKEIERLKSSRNVSAVGSNTNLVLEQCATMDVSISYSRTTWI